MNMITMNTMMTRAILDLMWETHKKSYSHSHTDVCKHLR